MPEVRLIPVRGGSVGARIRLSVGARSSCGTREGDDLPAQAGTSRRRCRRNLRQEANFCLSGRGLPAQAREVLCGTVGLRCAAPDATEFTRRASIRPRVTHFRCRSPATKGCAPATWSWTPPLRRKAPVVILGPSHHPFQPIRSRVPAWLPPREASHPRDCPCQALAMSAAGARATTS